MGLADYVGGGSTHHSLLSTDPKIIVPMPYRYKHMYGYTGNRRRLTEKGMKYHESVRKVVKDFQDRFGISEPLQGLFNLDVSYSLRRDAVGSNLGEYNYMLLSSLETCDLICSTSQIRSMTSNFALKGKKVKKGSALLVLHYFT